MCLKLKINLLSSQGFLIDKTDLCSMQFVVFFMLDLRLFLFYPNCRYVVYSACSCIGFVFLDFFIILSLITCLHLLSFSKNFSVFSTWLFLSFSYISHSILIFSLFLYAYFPSSSILFFPLLLSFLSASLSFILSHLFSLTLPFDLSLYTQVLSLSLSLPLSLPRPLPSLLQPLLHPIFHLHLRIFIHIHLPNRVCLCAVFF